MNREHKQTRRSVISTSERHEDGGETASINVKPGLEWRELTFQRLGKQEWMKQQLNTSFPLSFPFSTWI